LENKENESDEDEDYKLETALTQVDNIMETNVQTKGMIK